MLIRVLSFHFLCWRLASRWCKMFTTWKTDSTEVLNISHQTKYIIPRSGLLINNPNTLKDYICIFPIRMYSSRFGENCIFIKCPTSAIHCWLLVALVTKSCQIICSYFTILVISPPTIGCIYGQNVRSYINFHIYFFPWCYK